MQRIGIKQYSAPYLRSPCRKSEEARAYLLACRDRWCHRQSRKARRSLAFVITVTSAVEQPPTGNPELSSLWGLLAVPIVSKALPVHAYPPTHAPRCPKGLCSHVLMAMLCSAVRCPLPAHLESAALNDAMRKDGHLITRKHKAHLEPVAGCGGSRLENKCGVVHPAPT